MVDENTKFYDMPEILQKIFLALDNIITENNKCRSDLNYLISNTADDFSAQKLQTECLKKWLDILSADLKTTDQVFDAISVDLVENLTFVKEIETDIVKQISVLISADRAKVEKGSNNRLERYLDNKQQSFRTKTVNAVETIQRNEKSMKDSQNSALVEEGQRDEFIKTILFQKEIINSLFSELKHMSTAINDIKQTYISIGEERVTRAKRNL